MPEETKIATLSDAGVDVQKTSLQGSDSSSQEDSQNQNADPVQVGNGEGESASTSSGGERPKASDFVRFRKKLNRIEQENSAVRQQNEQIITLLQSMHTAGQSSPSGSGQSNQKDLETKFWENPINVLQEIIGKTLEERIPQTFDKRISEMNRSRETEEAVQLVVSSELIKKDPEGIDRFGEVMRKFGLNEFSKSGSPLKAAQIALALMKIDGGNGSGAPNNMLKSQMSAHAGGGGSIQTKGTLTKDQIVQESLKIQEQVSQNPELRFDPKIQEKIKFLSEQAYK